MTNILIIGGCGYIGSRLYKYLSDVEGYTVKSVDNESFGNPANIPNDKKDYSSLTKDELSEFDIIILLAAHSSVAMSISNQFNATKNNIYNFIELTKKLNQKQKFIYMSSSSVYGSANTTNIDESFNDFYPINTYDMTKWITDQYIKMTDIEYYGLRLGTVNGGSPNLRNDIMINSMIHNGLKNNKIYLYITNIWRPILSIVDLCRSIDTIIAKGQDHRGIYNIASFNLTVKDIGTRVSEESGIPCETIKLDKAKNITNVKVQTNAYDFSISTKKFEEQYNFKFEGTPENIVKDLLESYHTSKKEGRKNDKSKLA
jgi:nucleoside-diphosphate-sugar epimerase